MGYAIETHQLTKRFGQTTALQSLDLVIEPGVVFGYLGPNGAGKTTTIRILAGLLRPSSGRAKVLDLDTWTERDRVHARLGYLPGDFAAYHDMIADDYLRYIGSLRTMSDKNAITDLAKRLDLDIGRRIGTLSHGNRQKVGIVQAFMHRPEVLILDEPTAGLDPLVQREFIKLVRERRDDGCTVFLSSHILSEVESIADRVGILRAGVLVGDRTVADVRSSATRRIDLIFERPPAPEVLRGAQGVRAVSYSGSTAHVVAAGSLADLMRVVAPYGVQNIVTHEADLEEVFLSYYGKGGESGADQRLPQEPA